MKRSGKACIGSVMDMAALSQPELVDIFPEIVTNQEILRYRLSYRAFRLGNAQGAKGEVSDVAGGDSPRLPDAGSFETVLGIDGFDSLADELDSAYAVLRDYRLAYRRHRMGHPNGASGQVEDLAKRLSISDIRLLPASQLVQFNLQLRERKKSFDRNDFSEESAIHLHVGAGRLGLGLVLPAIMVSGRPVAIVQRPSEAWNHALLKGRVKIHVNEEVVADLRVVTSLRDVDEALNAQEQAMLVLSEDQAVLCSLVARVASYSCAIGGKDLSGALSPIIQAIEQVHTDAIDKSKALDGLAPPVVPLYACENDHEAVEKLGEALAGRIEVVPVLVDRVCTAREMNKDGSVHVSTEAYTGDLVLTPPSDVAALRPPLPFAGEQVKQPQTAEGAAFLHRKKILSVNGTHTTIAFLTLLAGESPDHIGPPAASHELLAFDMDLAVQSRACDADPVGRIVWVWAVARQLMLLYEFDGTVVRHTLGVPAADGPESDDALIEALLSGAKTSVNRLSAGGDQTSRVLGGGVENRWRTRLANVQEFLQGIVRLDILSKRLLHNAGVSETELRSSVSQLVKDSKRFLMVARPRSPSPKGRLLGDLPLRASPEAQRSPNPWRPGWLRKTSRSKSPGQKDKLPSVVPFPKFPQL